ncbi:MAG: glycosyltransferase [Thermoflexales bacterium]
MPHRPRLIFTAPKIIQGFMTTDMRLLSEWAEVIPLDLSECGGFQRHTYYTRLLDALIRQRADGVFAYFVLAKYTPLLTLITKALRRKLIVATGGIDATWVPDIRWGDMGDPLKRRLFALVMRLSDSVLPFSRTSGEEVLRYGRPRCMRTAYLGIDTDLFRPGDQPRARRAVTACYAISRDALLQKGIEPFVRAAAFLPDVEFLVIGAFADDTLTYLRSLSGLNVRFTERRYSVPEYVNALQTSQAYVQASAHEGFGVSLAEGMACGCVPVVADRYAMPEVIGDTGFVVPFNDPKALAEGICAALNHPEKGALARQRVLDNFTLEHRRALLREELEAVFGWTLHP